MKRRIFSTSEDNNLLSFADMIAALFAIFILAYILNIIINQLEKEKGFEGQLKETFYLSDKLLFESGRANIRKEGIDSLINLANNTLLKHPRFINDTTIILVQGFTDNKKIETYEFPSNWELSTKRAVNVVKLLIDKGGIPPNRIAAAGFSEFYPDAPNDTEEGRALNRTIKITIVDKDALLKK
ncbi:MAG: OmpA family protein [Candidatus Woesearchaeota archaeon]